MYVNKIKPENIIKLAIVFAGKEPYINKIKERLKEKKSQNLIPKSKNQFQIMKYRYFLQLAYKGTNYHGWQIQPNAITVQEVLSNKISTFLREEIQITGAGRTDTGVHASYFMAHFDSEQSDICQTEFIYRMNSFLPVDIALHGIFRVKDDANSRFDALSRTYKYYISTQKDPFKTEFAYYLPVKLNLEIMTKASEILFEYTDFTSFSRLHTQTKTNDCKIMQAEWHKTDNELIFTIKADRFLRNMVRAITGTLIEIGRNKLTVDDFRGIIEVKNRKMAGMSAPAHGLFLTGIEYPDGLFL